MIYPYLKRFTWLCHLWLGAVDGLAPVGAWVAITGRAAVAGWVLGGAVALWVAGFDLFYALFDLEIDRAQGLHSCADALRRARRVPRSARLCTARTVVLLVAAGLGLTSVSSYWLGVAAVAVLLAVRALARPPATCAGWTPRSSR